METTNELPNDIELGGSVERIEPENAVGSASQNANALIKPPIETIAGFMRTIGFGAIALSGVTFAFHQIDSVSSGIQKTLLFVGFLLMVAAGSVFTGAKLQGGKAARLGLTAVLALIPVTFLQLGGSVYATLVGLSAAAPAAFRLEPVATSFLPVAILGSAIALGVATLFATRVLIAGRSLLFAGMFMAMNLMLLVPSRSPLAMSGLLLALAAAGSYASLKSFAEGPQSRTVWAWVARAALFVPVLVIPIRNCVVHDVSLFLIGTLFVAISAVIGFVVPKGAGRNRTDAESTAATLALALGIVAQSHSFPGIDSVVALNAAHTLGMLASGLVIILMSRGNQSAGAALRVIGGLLCVYAGLTDRAFDSVLFDALTFMTAVGIGVIAFGTASVMLGICAALLAGPSIVNLVHQAIQFGMFGWFSLGVVGLVTLMGSAVLEKQLNRAARVKGVVREYFE